MKIYLRLAMFTQHFIKGFTSVLTRAKHQVHKAVKEMAPQVSSFIGGTFSLTKITLRELKEKYDRLITS